MYLVYIQGPLFLLANYRPRRTYGKHIYLYKVLKNVYYLRKTFNSNKEIEYSMHPFTNHKKKYIADNADVVFIFIITWRFNKIDRK